MPKPTKRSVRDVLCFLLTAITYEKSRGDFAANDNSAKLNARSHEFVSIRAYPRAKSRTSASLILQLSHLDGYLMVSKV